MPQKIRIDPDQIEAFFAQGRSRERKPNRLDCLKTMTPWKFVQPDDFGGKVRNFVGRIRRYAIDESERQGKDIGAHVLLGDDGSVTACLYELTPDEVELRRKQQANGFHMRKVVDARLQLEKEAAKEDPEAKSDEISQYIGEIADSF